ncbi:MAG: bifunctional folylpolyglutamate synthase/dihydrofolate synthase [Thermoplasmata archaeon]|nr:bifunctional folylpolyglutamate synthase/dihydrofolate synthase [Thermoplasmata archaeon]
MPQDEYRATLDRLFALRRFGMRPGLEVMQGLLAALDHPERSFRALHVTGSKGKGSVSAMAASILSRVTRPVGLFTSPHLVSYRERIRIDGRPIPKSSVVAGIRRIGAVAERLVTSGEIDRPPTFFELTTALAFDHFRAKGARYAVIEVGLGGRLDSTNVLDAPVGAITTIELEHAEILGPTLVDIAREKAGILRPGMRAVVGEISEAPMREIERVARGAGVPIEHLGSEVRVADRTLDEHGQTFTVTTPRRTYAELRLPMHGIFQPANTAVAVAAVEEFARAVGRELPEAAVREGLAHVKWRGRIERVVRRPEVFLDVAHTPESARAVAMSLAEIYPFLDPDENVIVFGCLSDKRAEEILEGLSAIAKTLIVVALRSDRAMPADALRRAGVGRFPKIVVAPDVASALTLARAATGEEGFALAVGSDYLVGDLLKVLEGPGDDEPDLSDPVPPRGKQGSAA